MKIIRHITNYERKVRNNRRGSALFLALVFTIAFAGLATSALYVAGNSVVLTNTLDHERDLKYAADAALAMGKSRLNYDPLAVPNSGYTQIMSNQTVSGADGQPIPNITVNVYIGPTSSNTGQFGRFVSVVAQAKDGRGGQFVRRLELAQESFAKYAYWSNSETSGGSTIYFGGNDQLWGPVWSNDVISIYNTGATFHDVVGTAKTISGLSYGTFVKGYSQNQRAITLPNNTTLSSLPGYASAGNESFTAPNSGTTQQALMRLEFDAVDLNSDGLITGVDEGFFKVYVATSTSGYGATWLRADSDNVATNCGAAFHFKSNGPLLFVPLTSMTGTFTNGMTAPVTSGKSKRAGNYFWFDTAVKAITPATFASWNTDIGLTTTKATTLLTNPQSVVFGLNTAHCYMGGDPHLAAIERPTNAIYTTTGGTKPIPADVTTANYTTAVTLLAGDSTTWTDSSAYGHWVKWPGTVDARVTAARPNDATFLYPIYRGLNSGTKGVIYVSGTTGLSGTLRGRITIYATGNVALLDDLKYATDPAVGSCQDILGIIAGNNISIADNSLNGPQAFTGTYANYGNNQDVYIQGVMMALNTSFGAEDYNTGPTNVNGCQGAQDGRGCIYLTGGIIQQSRGAVGTTAGTGYTKQYSYDHCALYNPPPYFPTTGRYTDNRYFELDPSRFNVVTLFQALTP